jgi:hypothetical protein
MLLSTSTPSLFNDFVIYPHPRHIILALDKIKNELSITWPSISKFAHEERNTLMIAVIIM